MHVENLNSGPHWNLLLECYELVKATPDETINLCRWRCDTQCCAGGLLATTPDFVDRGLFLRDISDRYGLEEGGTYELVFKSDAMFYPLYTFDALAALFNITEFEAEILFKSAVDNFGRRLSPDVTDRQVFLNRMEKFFAHHGRTLSINLTIEA